MENILVTGGAGFIGSHLAIAIKKKWRKSRVIALDNLIRRGSRLNIVRLKENGVEFIRGDVRNKKDLDFKKTRISLIIECSAEPSVLAGLNESPQYVIDTNLMGAVNCLELARRDKADLLFLSTSRIYPIEKLRTLKFKETASRFVLTPQQLHPGVSVKGVSEGFPLEGWRSIYGATKLSAELLIQEYLKAYQLKAVINRCSVVAGPWQMGKADQGVFTFWMINHYFKKELRYIGYRGSGKQVRDILHVDDLVSLVLQQMQNRESWDGQTYNVGGGEFSLSLRETTDICQKLIGSRISIGKIVKNREVDIPVFTTDHAKVTKTTGWRPRMSPERTLFDIYHWIKANEKRISKFLL